MNVVPSPTRLSTSIDPPWRSTSRRRRRGRAGALLLRGEERVEDLAGASPAGCGPVSAMTISFVPSEVRVATSRRPPLPIASHALIATFTNAWRSWPKSASTGGSSACVRWIATPCVAIWFATSESASSSAAFASIAFWAIARSRAKSSRLRTIAEQRCASRSTRLVPAGTARRVSSGGPSSSVRETSFANVEDPASGLLISWAMDADSLPSEESFSVRTSCSWVASSAAVRARPPPRARR